jgi:hypothetical protein
MAIYQEKTKMTQRPLTAAELAKAKQAYQLIGELYAATNVACVLVNASNFLVQVVNHGTSDGRPLKAERVPTKDDIGKRVKVRPSGVSSQWMTGFVLVGFRDDFFVVYDPSGGYFSFFNCILDEEAAQ